MSLHSLTRKQLNHTINYAEEIIQNLSPKAFSELLGGYDNDIDKLFSEILNQTSRIVNFNETSIESEKLGFLSHLEKSMDEQLKILSYNYFKTTCLPNFHQGTRNLEWGNQIQLNPKIALLCERGSGKSFEVCFAFPLWRLYSYNRPSFYIKDTIDNRNRKETMIITNESTLGKNHMSKIVEEIKYNDILCDKINPNNKAELNKEGVISETGSLLKLRTFGSSGIRGNHIGTCIVDDFLDKSALYSKEQRSKFNEVFYAEIINIVEPGGHLIVSGTPFHERDLYNDLKNDESFIVFEYPGIFPNGQILAPDRYTFKHLMELKKSLGSIVFAREHLVCPVSDGSSLFPWEYLEKAFVGMENVNFVENIESYPFKLIKVITGIDFAISGAIGADNSVFATWGIDSMDNYHLLNIKKLHGASHNEQVSTIVSINQRFKPNKMVAESNGFQSILVDLVKQRGVKNIEPFTTTAGNKKDLYSGLPSLSAMFERSQIKIPYAEGDTRNTTNWLCGEFNSVSFNEDNGKLESVGEHDDGPMACFLSINSLRENKNIFRAYSV